MIVSTTVSNFVKIRHVLTILH